MDSTKICKKYLKSNTAALWQTTFLFKFCFVILPFYFCLFTFYFLPTSPFGLASQTGHCYMPWWARRASVSKACFQQQCLPGTQSQPKNPVYPVNPVQNFLNFAL